MSNLIRLTDLTREKVLEIFRIADEVRNGQYKSFLSQKTVVMFFPETSIRTRVTFEKGIHLLGGQTILFPPETLNKREELEDVMGYLNNWADCIVVRHKSIEVLEKLGSHASCPVINAMTDINHPCEMLADLYALSKRRDDFFADEYLFVGAEGNIGLAWKEVADVMGLHLSQCCKEKYMMAGVNHFENIHEAIIGKDIICTDSLPKDYLEDFKSNQITVDVMKHANPGAILNPCPPFYRGEEITKEVVDSPYFVGYKFKEYLLEIQQAVIIYSMTH